MTDFRKRMSFCYGAHCLMTRKLFFSPSSNVHLETFRIGTTRFSMVRMSVVLVRSCLTCGKFSESMDRKIFFNVVGASVKEK